MDTPSVLSIAPSVIAIGLALLTRQVYASLAAGIAVGYVILAGGAVGAGLADTVAGIVGVLGEASSANVILFTFVMGALIAVMTDSGGMRGFIAYLRSRGWINDGKRSEWLAFVLGVVIFIESNITVLVAGSVARPLFDRFGRAREKLAYLIDSTSAPICMLIPLNAWGAYNIGLLSETGVADPLGVLLVAVPLNLYAIFAVLVAGACVAFSIDIGPMRAAERRAAAQPLEIDDGDEPAPGRGGAANAIVPVLVMVGVMPLGLWITGDGNLSQGSGSTSVLWAALCAFGTAWLIAAARGQRAVLKNEQSVLNGARNLLPMAIVMLLAFTLGDVAGKLEAGPYIATLVPAGSPAHLLLPAIFVIASTVAFSIGSSWSTFAILIPIVVPLATAFGLPPAPFVAAALSGGIFGDHASPISDTTIIASLASGSDHIEHVRTQLPYALTAGIPALIGFFVIGSLI